MSTATSTAAQQGAPAKEKEKPSRFPRHYWRFILSGYYGLNVALLASYIPIKAAYEHAEVYNGAIFTVELKDFASWERYMSWLCIGSAFIKSWNTRSVDAAAVTVLGFAQLFVAIMALICSQVLLAYLVIAYLLILLLFPQPFYPLQDAVDHLTPAAFLESVLKPDTDASWVIYLGADWHATSRHLACTFAEVAHRYATDKLKFAMLDLGEFNKLAGKLDIELSPTSWQLPTVVLYEKGAEVMRLPKKQNGKLYGSNFRGKDLVRSLELDMRYARSLQKAADKKDK